MSDPTVLTIVLNYRTADMTLDAATAALREMEGIDGELIIVDNDSQDGSFEKMEAAAQQAGWTEGNRVRVIASSHNGGFGAGNNVGIRAGLSDGRRPNYVYILNSDAFPDSGSIRRLLDYLQTHPETGFAGSYIHGPDGEPHWTTFRYPSIWSEFEDAARIGPISRLLARHVVSMPVPDATRTVDWLAGASLMMRRDVLDKIGLFDETFFLYFEETDLCRRAALAGWPTVYVRDSEVTHIGSVSTGMKDRKRMPDYWFDSRHHYFVKNHGRVYAAATVLARMLGGFLGGIQRRIKREPSSHPPHFLRDMVAHAGRVTLRGARSRN